MFTMLEMVEIRTDLRALRRAIQTLRDDVRDLKINLKGLHRKTNLALGLLGVLVVQAVLLPLFR